MPRNRRARSVLVVALAAGVLAAPAAFGEDWVEPRSNDAGRVPETALVPTAEQEGLPLDAISGVLEQFDQGRGVPLTPTDGQDMFAIWIADPAGFSARAIPVGSTLTNPQLFLFDANGFGVLANRDFQTFDQYPRLGPVADDGTFTLTTPGLYYLAISGVGSDPFSGSTMSPIFNFGVPIEISGPDGPGGMSPLVDWTDPSMYGSYYIELTGVTFAPAPGAGVLAAMGAAAAMRRRRR